MRGICAMLPEKPEVYSRCPEEDWHYGIACLGGLYRSTPGAAASRTEAGDWYLTTVPDKVKFLSKKGVRPVLLCPETGCLTSAYLKNMEDYQVVAVSEERSFRLLKQAGLTNVALIPEPAFLVERRLRPLADAENTVALCLINPGDGGSILYRNYCRLIQYILDETSLHILFMAYCVKADQNDGTLLRFLYSRYRDSGRVSLGKDGDTRELQGDLCRCRLCVGGAGAVAAWGCGVPSLCLSATGRTLGLAEDLLGSRQEGVMPWQLLKREEDLTESFRRLLKNEDRHRKSLERNLPRCRSGNPPRSVYV